MSTENRALWELVKKWREAASYDRANDLIGFGFASKEDCADELAAILERPVVVGGWLPIESAPKEITATRGNSKYGKHILLSDGREVIRGRWWETVEGEAMNFISDVGGKFHATHWMPLPAPPETNESMVRGKS